MGNNYGETNWGDTKTSGGNDFINLVEGKNRFRIITKPYQFIVHWTKDPSGANRKLRCATKDCAVCRDLDVKAQYRWYVGVIARGAEEKCGILEISSQVMTAVKSYATGEDWGDPTGYDIVVKRAPKGTNPLYTVEPIPHKKLTKDEQKMIADFNENVDLEKMVTPPTPEALIEKLLELGFTDIGSSESNSDDGDDFDFEDDKK